MSNPLNDTWAQIGIKQYAFTLFPCVLHVLPISKLLDSKALKCLDEKYKLLNQPKNVLSPFTPDFLNLDILLTSLYSGTFPNVFPLEWRNQVHVWESQSNLRNATRERMRSSTVPGLC